MPTASATSGGWSGRRASHRSSCSPTSKRAARLVAGPTVCVLVSVLFSSVQFNSRWCLCTRGKNIYIPPRLSEVSPTCLRKGSSVHRVDDGPLLYVLSRKIVERFLFLGLSLLQAIDCVMSLGSVTGGTVSSSSTFKIIRDVSHL